MSYQQSLHFVLVNEPDFIFWQLVDKMNHFKRIHRACNCDISGSSSAAFSFVPSHRLELKTPFRWEDGSQSGNGRANNRDCWHGIWFWCNREKEWQPKDEWQSLINSLDRWTFSTYRVFVRWSLVNAILMYCAVSFDFLDCHVSWQITRPDNVKFMTVQMHWMRQIVI